MNLEDMISEVKYPILSLFMIAEKLTETFNDYGSIIPRCGERKEFLNKVFVLAELLSAAAKHLENIREEYQAEVDKQYSLQNSTFS